VNTVRRRLMKIMHLRAESSEQVVMQSMYTGGVFRLLLSAN